MAVDAHSKWPEVFIMSSTTTTATIGVLRQLFAAYGLPAQVVTDSGSQFTLDEFATFMKMNGIKHIKSAPYHPATNRLAERFVQSLKQALRTSLNGGRTLPHRLTNFLLTYRSYPHATTGVTPCSLFLKHQIRTCFDLLKPKQESQVTEKQSQQKANHEQYARSRQFQVGQSVMARNLCLGPKWVPGVIVQSLGPLSYLIKTREGQTWRRHVDYLKKLHTEPETVNGAENSDSDVDSWELPSTAHSDTPETTESGDTSGNSGPGAENAPADELPNTSETENAEAEASSGGSTR